MKNWTHGNTMGRIVVKLRVAYDSDVEKVREVLRACGDDHLQVLRAPPPAVYLMGIGDIGLEFELRCLIANVEQAIAVSTELRLEILRRFAHMRSGSRSCRTTPVPRGPPRPRFPGPRAPEANRFSSGARHGPEKADD